jgi:hypothetical protein
MNVFARVACVVVAFVTLVISYRAAGDLYVTGFPDGHLTDYDKAVDTPKRILMWVELGFVVLFVALALVRTGTRARAVGMLAALTVLGVVVVAQLVAIPWYFGTHLGLDNGVGG